MPRFGEEGTVGWATWYKQVKETVQAKRDAVVPDYDPLAGTEDYEDLMKKEEEELLRDYEGNVIDDEPLLEGSDVEEVAGDVVMRGTDAQKKIFQKKLLEKFGARGT